MVNAVVKKSRSKCLNTGDRIQDTDLRILYSLFCILYSILQFLHDLVYLDSVFAASFRKVPGQFIVVDFESFDEF